MSSVQQKTDVTLVDELAGAGLTTSIGSDNAPLDLEGVSTADAEVARSVEEARSKLIKPEPSIGVEAKKAVNHPIARAAERAVNAQEGLQNKPEPELRNAKPAEVSPSIIKEGKLRVAQAAPLASEIEVQITPQVEKKTPLTPAPIDQPQTITRPAIERAISSEISAIPEHLLQKLNITSTEIGSTQVIDRISRETKSEVSTEPQMLQAERSTMSLEQAMKLDLSLAKIGTGQTMKPLTFRGHKLSSGTILDRLITALADLIKRIEMRFLSFLTRKRLERKAQKAKPVKVVLPTEEEDGLHTASFSNSLSRSRKKRNRWLARFRLER